LQFQMAKESSTDILQCTSCTRTPAKRKRRI
jgi:hypothetical protein